MKKPLVYAGGFLTLYPIMISGLLLFGISGGEIFLIMLFVLVFFGADKIPGMARTMGRTLRQVRDATSDIQRDIQNSANAVKDQIKDAAEDKDTKEK